MTQSYAPAAAAEELERGWADESVKEPIELTEDLSARHGNGAPGVLFSLPAGAMPLPRSLGEAISDDSHSIRFRVAGDQVNRAQRNPLHASFAALAKLRSSRSWGDWIATAAVLKSEAVRVRETPYARHSAVLLALADALTYTEPAESVIDAQAAVVDRALALLSEPFLSEPDEERFLGDLLSYGWNLVPAAAGA